MTAKTIFSKTMIFCWYKLGLGMATVVISAVIFGVIVGIGSLFGDGGMGIGIIIWAGATGVVRFVLMHYIGYMLKAGHIAMIMTAATTGQLPPDQFNAAKAMVTERFATSNIYFAVDKLVSGAVKQLQGILDKAGNLLDAVPGVDAVVKVGKIFLDISLGYIDECCLGYTFYKQEQNAFKSAADGVVIYYQNWKKLLSAAAKTTAVVVIATIGITLVVFVIIGGLFKLLGLSGLVAFILALLVAFAVKFAFIDSWVLVKTMVTYMEVAPATVISFDLYGKLCGISAKFKELWEKATSNKTAPQPAYAAAGTAAPAAASNNTPPAVPASAKPAFCGQCGAKNAPGTRFCGECGANMG